MFENSVQRGTVCRILVARLPGGSDRWFARDEAGVARPTDATIDAIENGSPMSSGEKLMLRAALDVWNGRGGLKMADAIDVLDSRNLTMLGNLLVGLRKPALIRDWIRTHGDLGR